jgi:bifunctional enzyme CysN/CysC
MQETELINQDILGYLEQHQKKELLRFVAVGSVDDGKSTLIGRLLHDTHGVYEDQLKAVKTASVKAGLEIDFSLFTDGLKAEREQGITIDVAYRYFSTAKRKFIIADTPGHVQYTRNMATGASTADVVIILIDARLGVLQQSRRHAYIASLLGIPQLAVCINKMDLEGHRQDVFERIRAEFAEFSEKLGFRGTTFIPVSALKGDNVVHPSKNMDWYRGPTLLQHLENVPATQGINLADLRYPVQYVLRPDLDYRGFSGAIASGRVRRGDSVMVLSSGKVTRVSSIDTFEGEVETAHAPMSVTLRLADEIDISRGDMLVHPNNGALVARRLNAMMVWMSEKPLDPRRSYLLKHTTQVVRAEVAHVGYTVDLQTLAQKPASRLELNDIGHVTLSCHRPLYCDPYRLNRATGAFILIDTLSNRTVAAGMIVDAAAEGAASDHAADGRSSSSMRPRSQVSARERWERLGQKGCVVWLAGGSPAGNSEAAYALERRLFDLRRMAMVVDLDERSSDAPSGGAAAPAIGEPAAEVVRSCVDLGLIVVLAGASALRTDRDALLAAVGRERVVDVDLDGARDAANTDAIIQLLVDKSFLPSSVPAPAN